MGCSVEDAQDLTQGFFARFLEKKYLKSVDPCRGRFRSFLLASLKHFCANEWRRGEAEKRGGGRLAIALDAMTAEERYRLEPSEQMTAEDVYEWRWAMTVLQTVVEKLGQECRASGKEALYEELKGCLSADGDTRAYAEVGTRLGLNADAVKTAVYRLRQRYRELLRSEVADTVADGGEVDTELRHLFAVLSRNRGG
jgi:DNA-directed RNA polymerase specialized sigma24 family protein